MAHLRGLFYPVLRTDISCTPNGVKQVFFLISRRKFPIQGTKKKNYRHPSANYIFVLQILNVLMSGMLKVLIPNARFFVLFDYNIQCMGESFQGYS